MRIEMVGWQNKGLRCPDIKVDLKSTNGDPADIALIQMPNGTGKTTTLTMIKAAMTGEATSWNSDTIKGFRRPGEENSEGRFILTLAVDRHPLTFEIILDFEAGLATYRTTSPGSGGVTKGWNPPPNVRRFLNERFVNLFVFDGEFADRLLDTKQSEAARAIDALCQLYLLKDVREKAEEWWLQATKTSGPKTAQGLAIWRNKVEKLNKRIRMVKTALTDAENKKSDLDKEVRGLQDSIDKQIGSQKNLQEELSRKKEHEKETRLKVETATVAVMSKIRQPYLLHEAFSTSLIELKGQMDRLKLPSSTSSQFFVELLEEPECVCGRPLDDKSKQVVRERAALYLAEETTGFLNTLKQDIALHLIKNEDEKTSNDLTLVVADLRKSMIDNQKARTELRALTEQLIEMGDEDLKQWQKEKDAKDEKILKLKDLIEEISRSPLPNDDENTKCLKSLANQLKEAKNKLSQITGTIELRARTQEVLSIVVDENFGRILMFPPLRSLYRLVY